MITFTEFLAYISYIGYEFDSEDDARDSYYDGLANEADIAYDESHI